MTDDEFGVRDEGEGSKEATTSADCVRLYRRISIPGFDLIRVRRTFSCSYLGQDEANRLREFAIEYLRGLAPRCEGSNQSRNEIANEIEQNLDAHLEQFMSETQKRKYRSIRRRSVKEREDRVLNRQVATRGPRPFETLSDDTLKGNKVARMNDLIFVLVYT